MDDMNPFGKLGEAVRRSSDASATPEVTISRAKEGALARWNARSTVRKQRMAVVLAFAVAVVALLFVRRSRVEPAITYSVGSEASNGTIGAWIAAGSETIPLRFSEGTAVTLEPGARGRVTGTNAHGATMLVERGRAHAKVVHVGQTTSWLVHAGPFDVNVVGTEFDVAWDPTLEVFDLRVSEGKVVVRGPLLDGGRAISANEVLRVDVQHHASETRTNTPETQEQGTVTPPAVPPTNTAEPSKKVENVVPAPVVSPEKPLAVPAWQKLAAAGKHREALEAAEQAGFDTILMNSSAAALLDLADEARFAGSPGRAKQALLRAREIGARGRSAFLLGKIAADNDRAPADAVSWFQRYLEESPAGGLAEQALGRIVEIEDKLGRGDEARKAAESYLQRYPGGAYETLARRVVEP